MRMQLDYTGYRDVEERVETCPYCNGISTELVQNLEPHEEAEIWVCHECEVDFRVERPIPW